MYLRAGPLVRVTVLFRWYIESNVWREAFPHVDFAIAYGVMAER